MVRIVFLVLALVFLANCSKPRSVVATVRLAGGSAEACLVARHGYEPLDNCIQRVRFESGEERLEFSGEPCPPSGPASSVSFSLSVQPVPGDSFQLYDGRGAGVRGDEPVGSLSVSNVLENLCSGPIYGGAFARCELRMVARRWGNLVATGTNPCN